MSKTIHEKIERSIQSLNVDTIERLYSNMDALEKTIERKPIVLDWLGAEYSVSRLGIPENAPQHFQSTHRETVWCWMLTLQAIYGDLRLQSVTALDLSHWRSVAFRTSFEQVFDLEHFRLPRHVSCIPSSSRYFWGNECHVEAGNTLDARTDMLRTGTAACSTPKWVLEPVSLPSLSDFFAWEHVLGLDLSHLQRDAVPEWLRLCEHSPVQWLVLPRGYREWGDLPLWKDTLKLLFVEDVEIERAWSWIVQHDLIEYLSLKKCKDTSLPTNMGALCNLKGLYCDNTPLEFLPNSLSDLTRLEELNLAYTNLEHFPKVILQIHNLERLIIREGDIHGAADWLTILKMNASSVEMIRQSRYANRDLWDFLVSHSSGKWY